MACATINHPFPNEGAISKRATRNRCGSTRSLHQVSRACQRWLISPFVPTALIEIINRDLVVESREAAKNRLWRFVLQVILPRFVADSYGFRLIHYKFPLVVAASNTFDRGFPFAFNRSRQSADRNEIGESRVKLRFQRSANRALLYSIESVRPVDPRKRKLASAQRKNRSREISDSG